MFLSLPRGTKMFQFPRFPLYTYVFSIQYAFFNAWVSPFGHLGLKRSLAAKPSLSQLITSFVGS